MTEENDPILHLRHSNEATVHGERTYRGWRVFFLERRYENLLSRVGKGCPAIVVQRRWYSKHPDKDGKMQEWGVFTDNNDPDGVVADWKLVEESARGHIDEFEGPPTLEDVEEWYDD